MLAELASALHEKNPDIETLTRSIAGNNEALKLIIDGLTFSVDTYRYNCNTLIVQLARTTPKAVFPFWDDLVRLLQSSNTYHRCSALNVIPHLIPVDGGAAFDGVFDRYFSRLDDESVIPPCYVARNCHTIVSHRPEWSQQIVERLLRIEETHHEAGRKDLIKADIIEALDRLFDAVDNKSEILVFVEKQLECSSPKTRKAAAAFLQRHR